MQNEKENIDILIKSLLENAEEEVPAGVWEKVSSRLDKQAVKPVFLWWRRTAVAIAVAASVAVGIFLNYKPDRSQGGTGTDSFAESNKETPELFSERSSSQAIRAKASAAELSSYSAICSGFADKAIFSSFSIV